MTSKAAPAKTRKGDILDLKKLPRNEVLLNIYDLGESKAMAKINVASNAIGGGVYHGGVEVFGVEWSYGCTDDDISGVGTCMPRAHPCHSYRCTVPMGQTKLGEIKVAKVLRKMEEEWRGLDYHFIKHNCLDFCSALCQELGCDRIPSWVDRYGRTAEKIGNVVSSPISGIKRASNFFGGKSKDKGADSPRSSATNPFSMGVGLDKSLLAEYRSDSDSDDDWYASRTRGADQWNGVGLRKQSATSFGSLGRSSSLEMMYAGGGGLKDARRKDPLASSFGFSTGSLTGGDLSVASTATPSGASSPTAKSTPGKAPPAAKAKGAPRKTPGTSPAPATPKDPSKSPAPRAKAPPGAKKAGPPLRRPSTPESRAAANQAANTGEEGAAAGEAPTGPPKAKGKAVSVAPKPALPKVGASPVVPKARSDDALTLPAKAAAGRPRGSKERPPAKAGVRSPSVAPPPTTPAPEGAEPLQVPKAKARSPSVAPTPTNLASDVPKQQPVPKAKVRSPSAVVSPTTAEAADSQQQPQVPKAKALPKKASSPATAPVAKAKPKGQASPPKASSTQADAGPGAARVRRPSVASARSNSVAGKDGRSQPPSRGQSPLRSPKVPHEGAPGAEDGRPRKAQEAVTVPTPAPEEEESSRSHSLPKAAEPTSPELAHGFSEAAPDACLQEGTVATLAAEDGKGEAGWQQATASTVASETSSAPPGSGEDSANNAPTQGTRREEATAEEEQETGDMMGPVDSDPLWVEAVGSARHNVRTESL